MVVDLVLTATQTCSFSFGLSQLLCMHEPPHVDQTWFVLGTASVRARVDSENYTGDDASFPRWKQWFLGKKMKKQESKSSRFGPVNAHLEVRRIGELRRKVRQRSVPSSSTFVIYLTITIEFVLMISAHSVLYPDRLRPSKCKSPPFKARKTRLFIVIYVRLVEYRYNEKIVRNISLVSRLATTCCSKFQICQICCKKGCHKDNAANVLRGRNGSSVVRKKEATYLIHHIFQQRFLCRKRFY